VYLNQGKYVASIYCQVPAWFPDMLRNFYLVKNHKIAKIPTTTKAREKISADMNP
jgi:hypothetical protein